MDGVVRTRVGYSGGEKENPTYRSIGDHTETLEIDYNPEAISYEELLEIFWNGIDPLNEAISRQYMSINFYNDREQEILARESKLEKEKELGENLYVEIKPAGKFYLAEDYHQKYYLQQNAELMKELRSYYEDFYNLIDSTSAARINGYLGGYGDYYVLMGELSSFGLSSSGEEMLKDLVK